MSREAHVPFCERLRGQFPRPTQPVVDQLKNISQIEHSRHRSQLGFLLEVTAGLIAYTFQPKKPSLNLRDNEIAIFKRS
ncbi:hypothetical protein ACFQ0U_13315, partial [Photorhabdus akhurstii subsp. bharatensis]